MKEETEEEKVWEDRGRHRSFFMRWHIKVETSKKKNKKRI
jgi:hypothetical protein